MSTRRRPDPPTRPDAGRLVKTDTGTAYLDLSEAGAPVRRPSRGRGATGRRASRSGSPLLRRAATGTAYLDLPGSDGEPQPAAEEPERGARGVPAARAPEGESDRPAARPRSRPSRSAPDPDSLDALIALAGALPDGADRPTVPLDRRAEPDREAATRLLDPSEFRPGPGIPPPLPVRSSAPAAAVRPGIIGLRIHSPRPRRLAAFYCEILGFDLRATTPDAIHLRLGALDLAIGHAPEAATRHLRLVVPSLASVGAALAGQGHRFAWDAPVRDEGWRLAGQAWCQRLRDPDGDEVTVVEVRDAGRG